MPDNVLVIGAGVSGLTTAVCLAEAGHAVRVVATDPPPATTSAVAGALIAGQVPPSDPDFERHRVTLAEFGRLAGDPATGVHTATGRLVSRKGEGAPPWAADIDGFRPCTSEEAAGFPVAFWMSSPVVDMPRYLDYLAARLTAAGGVVEAGHPVASLAEAVALAGAAPVVVNCAGLGSRELAPDPGMMPVRGQHVIVDNPGVEEFFYERSPNPSVTSYIPHGDRLVLGGTVERGDARTQPDPAQTEEILRRCVEIEPRIAGAQVIGVDVGLRPGRAELRLESEQVNGARIVHNYGHGGVGVALSWGCAREVQTLVQAR